MRNTARESQDQLAAAIGVTKGAVSKWETSGNTNIDLEAFFKLAEHYRVDPRELALGKAASPSQQATIAGRRNGVDAALDRLPEEIRDPVRALIDALSTAMNPRYLEWSHREARRARERDAVHERDP